MQYLYYKLNVSLCWQTQMKKINQKTKWKSLFNYYFSFFENILCFCVYFSQPGVRKSEREKKHIHIYRQKHNVCLGLSNQYFSYFWFFYSYSLTDPSGSYIICLAWDRKILACPLSSIRILHTSITHFQHASIIQVFYRYFRLK